MGTWGSLNISFQDLLSVWRASGTSNENSVAEAWGGARPIQVGLSVRSLFDAYLAVKHWPKGASIAFSGVTIDHMVTIARAHGLRVIPLEVDPVTLLPSVEAVEAACAAGAVAVVITRLFGAVSPLNAIGEVTARHGCELVEDAAQAFAGDFHRGDPAAQLSLFSFGLIKRATALGGGVAVFASQTAADAVGKHMARWPRQSGRWFFERWVKALALRIATVPPVYAFLFACLRLAYEEPDHILGSLARGFPGDDLLGKIRFRPPPRLLGLLRRRLLQSHRWRCRQATQWHLFATSIGAWNGIGRGAARHASWLVAIRDPDPTALRHLLAAHGFDATRGATRLGAIDPNSTSAVWMDQV
ncbi:MAG: DegT/DnrJ/EryC1/StrS family aminotransferase, partial [Myxococcota bacterium]